MVFLFAEGKQDVASLDDVYTVKIGIFHTLKTVFIWLGVWILPVIAIGYFLDSELFNFLASDFLKLAVVTFGDAYAV